MNPLKNSYIVGISGRVKDKVWKIDEASALVHRRHLRYGPGPANCGPADARRPDVFWSEIYRDVESDSTEPFPTNRQIRRQVFEGLPAATSHDKDSVVCVALCNFDEPFGFIYVQHPIQNCLRAELWSY